MGTVYSSDHAYIINIPRGGTINFCTRGKFKGSTPPPLPVCRTTKQERWYQILWYLYL